MLPLLERITNCREAQDFCRYLANFNFLTEGKPVMLVSTWRNTMINHFKLIIFSGLVWLGIGTYLLTLGVHFIVGVAQGPVGDTPSLLAIFSRIAGGREQAASLLIVLGLCIGFLKGRLVFTKTVQKVVQRIISLPMPIQLSQVYGARYLGLIAGMVLLGMSLKWFHLSLDIRGMVDVAIGSALMNGALLYFRSGIAFRKNKSEIK